VQTKPKLIASAPVNKLSEKFSDDELDEYSSKNQRILLKILNLLLNFVKIKFFNKVIQKSKIQSKRA
jgi:hypothetical protein